MKRQGYVVDYELEKIILNKEFWQRATQDCTSEEYATLMEIRKDNPGYPIVKRTAKKRGSSQGMKMSFDNMRLYVIGETGKESAAYAELEMVIQKSKLMTSPHQYVKNWFEKQYPEVLTLKADAKAPEQKVAEAAPAETSTETIIDTAAEATTEQACA